MPVVRAVHRINSGRPRSARRCQSRAARLQRIHQPRPGRRPETAVRGDTLVLTDDGYDETRVIWNGMMEKNPSVSFCIGLQRDCDILRPW